MWTSNTRWQMARPYHLCRKRRKRVIINPEPKSAAISRPRQPAPETNAGRLGAVRGAHFGMNATRAIRRQYSAKSPFGPKAQRRRIPNQSPNGIPTRTFGSGSGQITGGACTSTTNGVANATNIPLYALNDTRRCHARRWSCPMTAAPSHRPSPKAAKDAPNGRPTENKPRARRIPAASTGSRRAQRSRRHHRRRLGRQWLHRPIPRLGKPRQKAPSRTRKEGGERAVNETLVPAGRAQKDQMQPFGGPVKVVIEPMLDRSVVSRRDLRKLWQSCQIDNPCDGDVQILPEQDKKVYFIGLRKHRTLVASRGQLWVGATQIPVWCRRNEGKEYLRPTEAEARAMAPW